MLKKLTSIVILASLFISQLITSIAQAEYTCQKDNMVLCNDKKCCGVADTTTPDPFDYNGILKTACGSGDIPMGMKTKSGERVCPCKVNLNPG